MSSQRFENLLFDLREEHNREVKQLRQHLRQKEEELSEWRLRVKYFETELRKCGQNTDSVDNPLISVSTQTEDITEEDLIEENISSEETSNYCTESDGTHNRKPGRPPPRRATRKLIVNHSTPDYCLASEPSSSSPEETELRINFQKNFKRIHRSSDEYYSDGEDIDLTKVLNNKRITKSIGRRRDTVWHHFQDLGQSTNESFRRAKCVYCDQEFHTSKANLMVRHLATNCDLCPNDIKNEFLDKLETDLESKRTDASNNNVLNNNTICGSGIGLSGRRRGRIWEHFEDLGRSLHGSYRKAKCVYCDTVFQTSKSPQMTRHLAKECALCPQEVILEFRDNSSSETNSNSLPSEEVIIEEEQQIIEENKIFSGRKRAKVWEHYKDLGKGRHGSFRKAKCLYCNELFALSRLTSMTRHLAKCCVLCPKEVSNEYLIEYNKYCQKRGEEYTDYLNQKKIQRSRSDSNSFNFEQQSSPV